MRTQLLCLAVIGVGAALVLSGGQDATAAITGSAHDFKGATWNGDGEICQPCHTPHNSAASTVGAPLWNHEITSATFTVYTSGTFEGGPAGQPDGVSKLCLSCHDGTVALDSFGGVTGTNFVTGSDLLGTDLSNDHPVGFTYDTSLATTDGELFDPSNTLSGLGGNIDADMLFGDSLECASCHDVHNAGAADYLLVKSNASSALCLTCHDK